MSEAPFTSEVCSVPGSRADLQVFNFKKLLKENMKCPVVAHSLPHCAKPQWDALPSPNLCALKGDSGHSYCPHGSKAAPMFVFFAFNMGFTGCFLLMPSSF